ncbi:MAG: hypothetical protein ABJN40_20920 [Sneathiella sp.]
MDQTTFKTIKPLSFTLWVFLLICVTIGSLLPVSAIPDGPPLVSDKIQHFSAYFSLGILAHLSVPQVRGKILLLALTFFASVLIEYVQPLSGRHFEGWDIVANSVGIATSILASWSLQAVRKVRRSQISEKRSNK